MYFTYVSSFEEKRERMKIQMKCKAKKFSLPLAALSPDIGSSSDNKQKTKK